MPNISFLTQSKLVLSDLFVEYLQSGIVSTQARKHSVTKVYLFTFLSLPELLLPTMKFLKSLPIPTRNLILKKKANDSHSHAIDLCTRRKLVCRPGSPVFSTASVAFYIRTCYTTSMLACKTLVWLNRPKQYFSNAYPRPESLCPRRTSLLDICKKITSSTLLHCHVGTRIVVNHIPFVWVFVQQCVCGTSGYSPKP